MSWADRAAPIVAEVINRVGRKDMTALRKALAEAYPWGNRANRPYKAWLSEVKRQLGHPLNAPRADLNNRQIDFLQDQRSFFPAPVLAHRQPPEDFLSSLN